MSRLCKGKALIQAENTSSHRCVGVGVDEEEDKKHVAFLFGIKL